MATRRERRILRLVAEELDDWAERELTRDQRKDLTHWAMVIEAIAAGAPHLVEVAE